MRVTVIIPCYNERKYIRQFLDSLIALEYDTSLLEIFLVDGGSSDGTLDTIDEYCADHAHIRLLQNPNRTVPYALNIGLARATGDLIARMDIHSHFPRDYIKKLVAWHARLEADNIGGVCKTGAIVDTGTAAAIAIAMSDKFGVGNSIFRVGTDKEYLEVDTVPFGCYRRAVFDRIGKFDERLTRNQDIEFNKRLIKSGGRIILVPEIVCTYYPRDNYRALAKNRFQTGNWIIRTSKLTGSMTNVSLRHFIPLCFLLSIFLPALLAPFTTWYLMMLPAFALGLYLAFMGGRAFALKKGKATAPRILAAFATIHFSYGFGSLKGLLQRAGGS
jgi:glycosyltransferase involved in cell wall biosynthesis